MAVGRRRRSMMLLVLFVVLMIAGFARGLQFGPTKSDGVVMREDTSEVREASTGEVIERASSTFIARPVSADEEVEKAEAELRANGTDTSASSASTPAPVPVPTPTTAAPTTATPTQSTPTPTTQTPSSSSGSGLSADDLSTVEEAEEGRNANSSLDKTVVIVIIGIVAAIGITALLVSRQIKNMIDGESDDEL